MRLVLIPLNPLQVVNSHCDGPPTLIMYFCCHSVDHLPIFLVSRYVLCLCRKVTDPGNARKGIALDGS